MEAAGEAFRGAVMKKILLVINTLGHAGAEVALLELCRHFDPAEYELSLYVLMGQGEMIHKLPEYVKVKNLHYDDSSVLSSAGKKHMIRQVLKAFFTRGCGLKNIPYLVGNLWSMLKKRRVLPDKLLWRILSDGGQIFNEHYDLAVAYLEGGSTYYVTDHVNADKKAAFVHVDYQRAGYTRKLDRECYLKLDKIFTVSDEVREAFLKAYPECADRTEVFHNLINQETIRRRAEEGTGFTDSYDGIRILSVGRLTAQKAYEISIQAMQLLKKQGVHARWYVLGEGNQRPKLESLIEQAGLKEDFLLLGAKDNPYPYMKQTDIYVHASRFEGKSIAIQEAQTLGCAMVVSDCSGNREQVTSGVDGILKPLTPQDVGEGILELIQDESLRKRLGENARGIKMTDESEMQKLFSLITE